MKQFSYKSRNNAGQMVSGTLEAANPMAAADFLLERGLTPVELTENSSGDQAFSALKQWIESKNRPTVSVPDLIIFCRQMYTITKAGVPLIGALHGLAGAIKQPTLSSTLAKVAQELESGMGLSIALGQHPQVFDPMFVNLVHVGENTGRLDEAFLQLADYLERDWENRKNIRTALRYPSFVISAIVVAVAIINVKVIPAFANMFSQFGAQLPLPTRILIGTSDFFVNFWPYLLALIVGSGLAWREYLKTEKGQRFWGHHKLKLPIVGDIIERASLARYSRSFAIMLKAGVPLTTALELCARVVDNLFLAERIRGIRNNIERGDSLLRSHSASGMFTPLVLQMIGVGEESGQVDGLLMEVAGYYEREVDYDIKSLSAKLEPLLIVIMAVFVLILALGIFLPMWEMYSVQQ